MGVLRGLHLFEGRSSLKSWVFGISVHCARARAARDVRSVPLSALESEPDDEGPSVSPDRFLDDGERRAGHWSRSPVAWPGQKVASQEMVSLVREALETLPEARTVMSLRDVDGWDSVEVCELLGISEGNQSVPRAPRQVEGSRLLLCDACRSYVRQMRQVLATSGKLTEESVPPNMRDSLRRAFRNSRKAGPGRGA